ncbi:MAG: hypothetical protein K1X87_04940 [Dehalococcoidia bacterium]|nr:hypothetical protein [Dehalococcoidia bacterium]
MVHISPSPFADREVRPAILTAIVLLAQAVIAKNVLDVELDIVSQFAPLYVFIAYQVSQLRTRGAELAFDAAIVLTAVGVLTLYAAT